MKTAEENKKRTVRAIQRGLVTMSIMGSMFFGRCAGVYQDREVISNGLKTIPIVQEFKDVNKDGIDDRVYKLRLEGSVFDGETVEQIQYGKRSGDEIKYFMKEQIEMDADEKKKREEERKRIEERKRCIENSVNEFISYGISKKEAYNAAVNKCGEGR